MNCEESNKKDWQKIYEENKKKDWHQREWYIIAYDDNDHLHHVTLLKRPYIPETKGDHDHCEVCWDRFSEYEGDQHEGYFEPIRKSWICSKCYREFKDLFGWTVPETDSELEE